MIWNHKDEIQFLNQMARSKNAAYKIKVWLHWSRKRRWPARFNIDKCVDRAEVLLYKLGQK